MNVKILSCWFTTSYGTYTSGLRRGLERRLGVPVGIVASNCGCGDPMEVERKFIDKRCELVELPNVSYYTMSTPTKQRVLDGARQVAYYARARRYLKVTGDADVMHFQQILNAFGSLPLFHWLGMPSRAARVVTVHELDPYQQAHPRASLGYNKADAILVHTEQMRGELVALGVEPDRIEVVHHGIDPDPTPEGPRKGLVFWGGHKLNASKGVATLFTALAILKDRLGSEAPVLTIHGHYGADTPELGARAALDAGVADRVRWLNEIPFDATLAEYKRAALCVLPFTGSFAGYPAVMAMASGVPVVATKRAGLPEHLGDAGVWVKESDPYDLAATLQRLLGDPGERQLVAAKGRARVDTEVSWDVVAGRTAATYETALRRKRATLTSSSKTVDRSKSSWPFNDELASAQRETKDA